MHDANFGRAILLTPKFIFATSVLNFNLLTQMVRSIFHFHNASIWCFLIRNITSTRYSYANFAYLLYPFSFLVRRVVCSACGFSLICFCSCCRCCSLSFGTLPFFPVPFIKLHLLRLTKQKQHNNKKKCNKNIWLETG